MELFTFITLLLIRIIFYTVFAITFFTCFALCIPLLLLYWIFKPYIDFDNTLYVNDVNIDLEE